VVSATLQHGYRGISQTGFLPMEIVDLERQSYQLDRATVAAVAEEAPGAEGGQRPSHGLDQRLSGASLGSA
jgi:hypothetical protein